MQWKKSFSQKPGICKDEAEHGECRNWQLPCVTRDMVMQGREGKV